MDAACRYYFQGIGLSGRQPDHAASRDAVRKSARIENHGICILDGAGRVGVGRQRGCGAALVAEDATEGQGTAGSVKELDLGNRGKYDRNRRCPSKSDRKCHKNPK